MHFRGAVKDHIRARDRRAENIAAVQVSDKLEDTCREVGVRVAYQSACLPILAARDQFFQQCVSDAAVRARHQRDHPRARFSNSRS